MGGAGAAQVGGVCAHRQLGGGGAFTGSGVQRPTSADSSPRTGGGPSAPSTRLQSGLSKGTGAVPGSSSGHAAASRQHVAAAGQQLCLIRSAAERLANPERLNLDRRGLKFCPLLQDEDRLRLLNYQNNEIAEITNLQTLPHLIFLDMYSNQIKQISGLEAVPTLRVLMLGKNEIERIEHLEVLLKLDVLDLHCNQLTKVGAAAAC